MTKSLTGSEFTEMVRVLFSEVGRHGDMIEFRFSWRVPNPGYGEVRPKSGKPDRRKSLERQKTLRFVSTSSAETYADLLSRELERRLS